jgi:F-type H+-transporting ATPase subunit delta
MAELSTIARPYAAAVFKAAVESGDLQRWSDALGAMATIAADPQMQELVSDPRLPVPKIVDLFLSLAGRQDDEQARNLLTMLAENDRLHALPEIEQQFRALRASREGSADAQIVSAYPLDDTTLASLVGALEKRFGRKIKPLVEVDSSLIGGITVRIGDEVIDASVRGKLAQMETALRN